MGRGLCPRQFMELFMTTEQERLVEAAFVQELG
jgi:hypothetical protein